MTFSDIMQIVQTLLIPLLGYAVWVLREINTKLHGLNIRITTMEEWAKGHEKLDDVRFTAVSALSTVVSNIRREGEHASH